MKRTAMLRKTPLRATRPLARHVAVRRINHTRIRARRAACFGAQAQLCRTMPCLICWEFPAVPHHEPPRSCGGKDESCVPLCDKHHRERHSIGRAAFELKHRVDLREHAARLAMLVGGQLDLPEQETSP